jgi:hypothetical protein
MSCSLVTTQNDKGWQLTQRWYLVRNDHNPSYKGPTCTKFFYSLVYIPEKGIFEKGHRKECLEAEHTKNKIYTFVVVGTSLAGIEIARYFLSGSVPSLANLSALNATVSNALNGTLSSALNATVNGTIHCLAGL